MSNMPIPVKHPAAESDTQVSGVARDLQNPFPRCAPGLLVLLFILFALVGCTPPFDWREIQPAQEPFIVMMPAKPAAMTRSINLDGRKVSMRMHGALVEGHSFTAAWVELDEADTPVDQRQQARNQALQAMQTGMTRNINGQVAQTTSVVVKLVSPAGDPVGQVPGRRLHITGTARGEPAEMHALFVGLGAMQFQFVVLGRDVPAEHVETFLDSVRIRTGRPRAVAHIGDQPDPVALTTRVGG